MVRSSYFLLLLFAHLSDAIPLWYGTGLPCRGSLESPSHVHSTTDSPAFEKTSANKGVEKKTRKRTHTFDVGLTEATRDLMRGWELAEEGKKEIGSVTRISFWEGYKGFSRIYITTNIGEFYLDVRSNVWSVKKGNPYTIDEIDMGSLRKKTFEKAGVSTEQELVKKYTPHKGKTTLVPTTIVSMRRWERVTEKGETMKRIYITTDVGNFFYDIVKDRWASNADSPNEIVDVDSLKALAFAKAGVTSEAEFAKFC